MDTTKLFGTEKISRILFRLAPPVMLAQLIQALYNIIDSRYRCGKPLILTTNLDLRQMKECQDIRYSRIYDRIFEMCYPVKAEGLSWRKKEAAGRYKETKELLEA